MDISAALAADLGALTESLGDPYVDLETHVLALAADLTRAVASYTGMTMTIALDGHPVGFTTHDSADGVATATSLRVPLRAHNATDDASSLIVYAATPGAFVDLAADLSFVLDLDPADLVLDRHRRKDALGNQPGMNGLAAYSRINQAIGVLIARGHTAESARQELRRVANLDGGLLHKAAETVLLSVPRPDGPGDHDDKDRGDDA